MDEKLQEEYDFRERLECIKSEDIQSSLQSAREETEELRKSNNQQFAEIIGWSKRYEELKAEADRMRFKSKEYFSYLHKCGMMLGAGEDHPEDIPDHVLDLRQERDESLNALEALKVIYVKYKHLDKVMTDPMFKTGEPSIDIKRDLWQAIKSAVFPPPAAPEKAETCETCQGVIAHGGIDPLTGKKCPACHGTGKPIAEGGEG